MRNYPRVLFDNIYNIHNIYLNFTCSILPEHRIFGALQQSLEDCTRMVGRLSPGRSCARGSAG